MKISGWVNINITCKISGIVKGPGKSITGDWSEKSNDKI